ncbi:MAG: F0F1 ATP synthase subunit B [Eubacteriales bacterium]|nr:F0F1 ATP synthase subunit B [Eubacteriales bacterium]MDD3881691.1 F0F1 ATP synthase subunit B [Eubacteriales bacterium]MDD4512250.1 F0F1 ATP synthase subunit B [Eubacteriales bacterium]
MDTFAKLINPSDILFHCINVVILFVALRVFLYKPVRKFMNKRDKMVTDQLDNAKQVVDDANVKLTEAKQTAEDAKKQAAQLMTEAAQKAHQTSVEMLERTRHQADDIVAQAKRDAEDEKNKAQDEIKTQAAALAVEIARKVLEREVKPEDNERLVDNFLTKVG